VAINGHWYYKDDRTNEIKSHPLDPEPTKEIVLIASSTSGPTITMDILYGNDALEPGMFNF
jgi:hypothetical protein